MLNGQEGIHAGNQHWAFYAPAAHLTEMPSREDENGLRYMTCNFRCGDYTGETSSVDGNAINTDARIFIATSD
jgi:hypothetical protein